MGNSHPPYRLDDALTLAFVLSVQRAKKALQMQGFGYSKTRVFFWLYRRDVRSLKALRPLDHIESNSLPF